MATDPTQPDSSLHLNGQVLLADPSLRDGTFNRAVILLTHHAPEFGATGLILNQPTGQVVGDLLTGKEFSALRQLAVHAGGPVSHDQLTFSSFWWTQKSGLRWALRISAEQAAYHARRPGRVVRAFLGYSGWSSGQLENELRHHSWITANPPPDLLGQEHDRSLWATLLRRVSPLHHILAVAPKDPFLN